MPLSGVTPPGSIQDIPSAREAINSAYRLIGQLSKSTDAQVQMIREIALSGLLSPKHIQQINQQLSIIGQSPINVTGLIGAGGTCTTGTHADRVVAIATPGDLFFETDRIALYVGIQGAWWLVSSSFLSSSADRPADLVSSDIGFTFYQQDASAGNIVWNWNGGAWDSAVGMAIGVLADLSGAYTASHALVGLQFWATDYNRLFVCSETAGPVNFWVDAPGQDPRGFWMPFQADPGVGWQLCDGSTVDMSQPDGSTVPVTVPDLISNRTYSAYDASEGAGSFGAAGVVYPDYAGIPYFRL